MGPGCTDSLRSFALMTGIKHIKIENQRSFDRTAPLWQPFDGNDEIHAGLFEPEANKE